MKAIAFKDENYCYLGRSPEEEMRCPWKSKERKKVKERGGTHLGSQSGGRDSRGDQAALENLKELE